MKQLVILFCVFSLVFQSNAQHTKTHSPIIIIYDASGSMWGQMQGKTKMEIASTVLSNTLNNLPESQRIGLVAYGHRKKGDCRDVEFLVDVNNGTKSDVNKSLKEIKPLGKTPLAYSATQVINKLRALKMKATIILITDGIESCDGNICNVIQAAKKEGIDFKLHIIGFGLKENETGQLRCAALAGEGSYYDAANASGLGDVLNTAMTTTIDDSPGNFSIYAVKNGQPVDAWVKAYKIGTKDIVDGGRSYKDSAWVYLPPGKYDIEIKPLEGSDISGTTISADIKEGEIKHRTVSFDGGKLEVTATNNGNDWDTVVKMLDKSTKKVIAQARTYGKVRYMEVNPGIYDVTFKALAMKGLDTKFKLESIEIKAGETTQVVHDFKTGIAKIGVKTATELVDATVSIREVNSGQSVAGSRTYASNTSNPREFVLNPGVYTVTIKTLGKHKGKKETFTIEVKAEETVEKIIIY